MTQTGSWVVFPAVAWFTRRMIGSIVNAAAILIGGAAGVGSSRDLSVANQSRIKIGLAVFTMYAGFSLVWSSVHGRFGQVAKQLGILFLALLLGNAAGRLVGIQTFLNRLGQYGKQRLGPGQGEGRGRLPFGDAFIVGTIFFCATPIGFLGALEDGLSGNFKILAIKAVMDGLAAMAFARMAGWGVMVSAIPVLAYQGTLTLLAVWLGQRLEGWGLVMDSIHAMAGLLVFLVALVILDLQKPPLGNYLPGLVFAPVLTWVVF